MLAGEIHNARQDDGSALGRNRFRERIRTDLRERAHVLFRNLGKRAIARSAEFVLDIGPIAVFIHGARGERSLGKYNRGEAERQKSGNQKSGNSRRKRDLLFSHCLSSQAQTGADASTCGLDITREEKRSYQRHDLSRILDVLNTCDTARRARTEFFHSLFE